MKCTKCGEQWELPNGKSHGFCPNCGTRLESAKKTAQKLDTIQGVLAYIADNLGTDVLLGSKIVSCFDDIARNQFPAEKKLIKILADEGALACLKEAIDKPESEQAIAVKRAVSRLPFAKSDGEEMLYHFAEVLGWQISKPVENPKPNIQPSRVNTSVLPNDSKIGRNAIAKPAVGSIYPFANIEWRVLAVENNKALLISEQILEIRHYHRTGIGITWENCSLRQYLNGEFLDSLGEAKSFISETRNNPNLDNPWFGTSTGCNPTDDMVFLLSLDEVCRYFGDSTANLAKRGSTGSNYFINDKNNSARIARYEGKKSFWWLRSPGDYNYMAATIRDNGHINMNGHAITSDYIGVRPALRLNL